MHAAVYNMDAERINTIPVTSTKIFDPNDPDKIVDTLVITTFYTEIGYHETLSHKITDFIAYNSISVRKDYGPSIVVYLEDIDLALNITDLLHTYGVANIVENDMIGGLLEMELCKTKILSGVGAALSLKVWEILLANKSNYNTYASKLKFVINAGTLTSVDILSTDQLSSLIVYLTKPRVNLLDTEQLITYEVLSTLPDNILITQDIGNLMKLLHPILLL